MLSSSVGGSAPVALGLEYWDDFPRFVGGDVWPAMIHKSMISAVHPEEDSIFYIHCGMIY